MNWNIFLINFIIIFLEVLIVVLLLKKSSKSKSTKEINDVEIHIKYLAIHHFKQYVNNYLSNMDMKEIEDYLVDNIVLESHYDEEQIRETVHPFMGKLMEGIRF